MEHSHQTDVELITQARNSDESARDALIVRHTGLARAIARRYAGRGLDFDDILQSGYLGLINAVDRYQPSRGVPLERYAARMIEGEIMHLFRDRGWAVRVPRALQELSRSVASSSDRLAHRLGRTPTTAELARHLGEDEDTVAEALVAHRAYRTETLDDNALGADGSERGDARLADEDPGFAGVEDRDQLSRAIRHLPRRERTMLSMRFFEDLTQSEIAVRMDMSQMHVSRLLRGAIDDLNALLDEAAA
jgi:RNA polymerase sigma-B factor